MPLLLCRRRRLLPLLLLLVAASHGDASDDTYDTSMCLQETTTCGDVSIRYPFYFSDKTGYINGSSNSYCGYPGLAIDCDDGKPILQLNGAEKYKVNYINVGSITNVSLVDQEVVDDSSGCPRVDHNETTTCGDVSIRYPFYFSDKTGYINGSSNSYCGYPGLAIDCDDGKPILQLNGAEKYKVNYINVGSITNVSLVDQEVVDDSSGCPRVDHNVTFAQGSWLFFPAGMSLDYLVFFLGCSFPNLFLPPENIDPITCSFIGLIGPSYVLPKDQVPPGNWSQFCKTFEVPVVKYQQMDPKGDAWRKGGYGQVLRQGFLLSVNDSRRPPNCTQCEESKGRCGFSQDGEFIGCLCPNGRVRSLRCSASDLTTGKPFVSRFALYLQRPKGVI
uniref:Wall-associated receptor kinase galacturonan-binding domain-containing protein n=1 Tax=Oryza meridionalis TaxID=40149 RepID=A0A0E0C6E9_9ORYZ